METYISTTAWVGARHNIVQPSDSRRIQKRVEEAKGCLSIGDAEVIQERDDRRKGLQFEELRTFYSIQ